MKVFADTFYWIALTDATDQYHERAVGIRAELVTTDEVLTEYLTFFCGAPSLLRREVALVVEDILRDRAIEVVAQSRESFLAGLRLYRDRPDKRYSLVDCISMQTMRAKGLIEVLTNDRHFEQEGFKAAFRQS